MTLWLEKSSMPRNHAVCGLTHAVQNLKYLILKQLTKSTPIFLFCLQVILLKYVGNFLLPSFSFTKEK